ncbi:hypothetical protein F4677DRAFT_462769 [Hypoxylon crocopeplum]|nr:hypothetical protein F4677DRAFT_462769 [Hypoxylon crocopeplum]
MSTAMELDQAKSPFFRLPAELRNRIYRFMGYNGGHWRYRISTLSGRERFKISDVPAFLLSCKRAYKEARLVLCAYVRIDTMYKHSNAWFQLNGCGNLLPARIHHLSIHYQLDGSHPDFVQFLKSVAEAAVNLRHLHITSATREPRRDCHCGRDGNGFCPTCKAAKIFLSSDRIEALVPLILSIKKLKTLEFGGRYRSAWAAFMRDRLASLLIERNVEVFKLDRKRVARKALRLVKTPVDLTMEGPEPATLSQVTYVWPPDFREYRYDGPKFWNEPQ